MRSNASIRQTVMDLILTWPGWNAEEIRYGGAALIQAKHVDYMVDLHVRAGQDDSDPDFPMAFISTAPGGGIWGDRTVLVNHNNVPFVVNQGFANRIIRRQTAGELTTVRWWIPAGDLQLLTPNSI